jgi:hypothetical protein
LYPELLERLRPTAPVGREYAPCDVEHGFEDVPEVVIKSLPPTALAADEPSQARRDPSGEPKLSESAAKSASTAARRSRPSRGPCMIRQAELAVGELPRIVVVTRMSRGRDRVRTSARASVSLTVDRAALGWACGAQRRLMTASHVGGRHARHA